MRQTGFSFIKDYKKEFGGSSLAGKRKTTRPLSVKNPIHLILKSTGSNYFVPDNRKIESLIRSHAEKYGIKLYEVSLNWSHIHLLVKLPSREAYLAFIRTITSLLVSLLSKLKGKSLKGLFDLRPFTRILSWGRDFRNVIAYHELNDMEARGFKRPKKKAKSSQKKSRHTKK
ncbi:MAG: transposase [Bdellovibrionales bacterium]|nr:transposase [Bdellovibrionales bacterium]